MVRIINPFMEHQQEGVWTPAEITTALWLDAADASTLYDATSGGSLVAADGAIARWQDKSGNSRHFLQSSSGSRPQRKTSIQNGLDIVRFDGTSDYLELGATSGFNNDQIADFIVLTWRDAVTSAQIAFRSAYSSGAAGNSNQLHGYYRQSGLSAYHARSSAGGLVGSFPAISSGTFLIAGVWASDDTVNQWVHGTAGTTGTGATASPTGHTLTRIAANSSSVGGYAAIDLCEWIRIIGGVTTDTIETVEGYLSHRWGLTSDLRSDHPYKTVAP